MKPQIIPDVKNKITNFHTRQQPANLHLNHFSEILKGRERGIEG